MTIEQFGNLNIDEWFHSKKFNRNYQIKRKVDNRISADVYDLQGNLITPYTSMGFFGIGDADFFDEGRHPDRVNTPQKIYEVGDCIVCPKWNLIITILGFASNGEYFGIVVDAGTNTLLGKGMVKQFDTLLPWEQILC